MQGRHTSWLIAGLVLFFGLLGALPFHNEADKTTAQQELGIGGADGLVWQETVSAPAFSAPQVAPPSFRETRFAEDPQVAPVTAITTLKPHTEDPPEMADQYGTLLKNYDQLSRRAPANAGQPLPIPHVAAKRPEAATGPQRLPRVEGNRATEASEARASAPRQFAPTIVRSLPPSSQAAEAAVAHRAASNPVTAQPQRHKIRDGDSLAAIAQRYLGDAGRAMDIFEANRDVLTDPELLPLGKQLVIPVHGALPGIPERSNDLRRLPPVQ